MYKISNIYFIMILALLIVLAGYFTIYYFTASIIIVIMGSIFLLFSKKINNKRKENLNIIQEKNELKFYLSDDIFFSVALSKNMDIGTTIKKVIRNEIHCLDKSVRKINFINFVDERLEKELNNILQIHQG